MSLFSVLASRKTQLLVLVSSSFCFALSSNAKPFHHKYHWSPPPTPTPTATPTATPTPTPPPPTPTPSPSGTPTPTPTATPSPTPSATPTPTPIPQGFTSPRGIFYLLGTDAPISSKQSCWTNPGVDGVRLRVSIGTLEPQAGVYDWTQLDAASALAQANGKQWTVGVIWGMACPQWVYDAGAVPVTLADGVMPTPWDPVEMSAELNFINAFAARYANDPSLAGVIIGGLGQVMETYVART
ncbi:MAG: hypothetical protein H0X40_14600, partial [Chthoniobacterales bacterium]|nr:hypothetical protein [Chthoniobacterales bacterium]